MFAVTSTYVMSKPQQTTVRSTGSKQERQEVFPLKANIGHNKSLKTAVPSLLVTLLTLLTLLPSLPFGFIN